MTSPDKIPLILAINPGATSTKIGLLAGSVWRLRQVIPHDAAELAKFDRVIDQYQYLKDYLAGANPLSICPDGLHPTDAVYVMKGQYAARVFPTLGL